MSSLMISGPVLPTVGGLTVNNSVTAVNVANSISFIGIVGPPGPQGIPGTGGGGGIVNVSGYITTGQADNRYLQITGNNYIVYTTGNQNISGIKTFNDALYITGSDSSNLFLGYDGAFSNLFINSNGLSIIDSAVSDGAGPEIDMYYGLINSSGSTTSIDWKRRQLWKDKQDSTASGASVPTLDWNNRFLSGEWMATSTGTTSSTIATYWRITGLSGVIQNQLNTCITTGQTGQFYSASNLQQYVTSGNLTQTGVQIESQINSLSGFSTGFSGYLFNKINSISTEVVTINGISGAVGILGTGIITIIGSGQNIIISGDTSILSGNLALTGSNLLGQINTVISNTSANALNISGNMAASGASLILRDINISGAIATQLTTTGQTLLNNIVSTSGSLASTGQSLYNYIIATSGFSTGASGYFFSQLTQTGVQIESQLNSLSGWVGGASGALQTQLSASAAGVSQLNNLSGSIIIVGTGNLFVYTGNPHNIIISGSGLGLAVDIINTSGSLAITGQTLYNNIVSVSGSLANTGQNLYNYITTTSGFATGASGYFQSYIPTFSIANLQTVPSGIYLVNPTLATNTIQQFSPAIYWSGNAWKNGTPTQSQSAVFRAYVQPLRSANTASINANWVLESLVSGTTGYVSPLTYSNRGLLSVSSLSATGLVTLGNTNINNNGIAIQDNALGNYLSIVPAETLSQGRALNIITNDSNRTISLVENTMLGNWFDQNVRSSGIPSFYSVIVSGIGSGILQVDVSGNLTGVNLSGILASQLTTTGALLSAIKITGSSIIPVANFTGLGGTLIIYSGNQIFVSGAAVGGGGITQGQLDSLSGYADAILVHRSGDEFISGSKTFTQKIIVSGGSGLFGWGGNAGNTSDSFLVAPWVFIGQKRPFSNFGSNDTSGTLVITDANKSAAIFGPVGDSLFGIQAYSPQGGTNSYGNLSFNQNGGKVGIGLPPTTIPSEKLHVSGNIRIDSGVYLSGATNISDLFYPRTNPSGYITLDTGISTTGANASIILRATTGAYVEILGNSVSGTAPSSSSLNLPITESIYGGTNFFLGNPDGWMNFLLSGRSVKIPYYY